MQYLKTYLSKITARGNEKLAESIFKTAEEVGEKYIKNFSFTSHEVGLLFGNVQSGKTGQMFGIITKATDLGFPVFVFDNVSTKTGYTIKSILLVLYSRVTLFSSNIYNIINILLGKVLKS